MITFEERWKINQRRRKEGKGDIKVRFVPVCMDCKKPRELANGRNNCMCIPSMRWYEKVVVNYK